MNQTTTPPMEQAVSEVKYPDDSWFWPVLENYRDKQGQTLREAEYDWIRNADCSPDAVERAIEQDQWTLSPKSERFVGYLLEVIGSRFDRSNPFQYLEFGTCFGTTITSVLHHCPAARGIGLEVNPSRFAVTEWLVAQVNQSFDLGDRLELRSKGLTKASLDPGSIDVVFMDTDHRYPDDYEYVRYLLESGVLKDGFLFVGDDPMHTGTCRARERFIAEHGSTYDITTSARKNLWWFQAR